jgi:hypothetical protein
MFSYFLKLEKISYFIVQKKFYCAKEILLKGIINLIILMLEKKTQKLAQTVQINYDPFLQLSVFTIYKIKLMIQGHFRSLPF